MQGRGCGEPWCAGCPARSTAHRRGELKHEGDTAGVWFHQQFLHKAALHNVCAKVGVYDAPQLRVHSRLRGGAFGRRGRGTARRARARAAASARR